MAFACPNCGSLFFKTLESRWASNSPALMLYKKRCKRCKHKYFLQQSLPTGKLTMSTFEAWQSAPKMSPGSGVVVSEYTRRISQGTDRTLSYHQRIQQAESRRRKTEESTHENNQATG